MIADPFTGLRGGTRPGILGGVNVAGWMSSPVHTVTPTTRVADAVALLRRHRIRHLPVTDGGRLVGVVTGQDLRRVEAVTEPDGVIGVVSDRDLRGAAPDATVSVLMSRPVVVVNPRTSIEKAARLLFDRRIGCLPVIDDGRLVGILTQTDAVAALVAVVRLQVGGRHAEVVVAFRPDAMAIAHQVIRPFGEMARLVGATREPFGRGLAPERVRLEIETREMPRVLEALRAAGLEILSASDNGRS